MPTLATGSIVQVTYRQRCFGQRILNVFHYRVVAESTAPSIEQEMLDLALHMSSLAGAAPLAGWRPLVGAELVFDEVRCQPVDPVRRAYQKQFIGSNGTNEDPCTLCDVALSVSKRTALAGREFVGRTQMCGIPASKYAAGEFTGPYLTAVGLGMSWILDIQSVVASDGSYEPVLWHGLGGGIEATPLFDIQPQSEVRTMHRRTVRLGE